MTRLLMLALLVPIAVFAEVRLKPDTTQEASAAFDVASIRPNTSGAAGGFRGVKGRTYLATNQALRSLIGDAYGLPAARVLGGPGWLGAASTDARFVGGERFDITATLPEGATAQQVPAMLRRLLAERFTLTAHTEMRDTPVYALVMARDDGRLGPQLRKASVDCDAAIEVKDRDKLCASEVGGAIIGRGQRIDRLARYLAMFAGRPVVDKTGLTGGFDFDVRFPELQTPANAPGGGPPSDGGGLFVAIQEQLGLKLEPATTPMEFLIVDAIERPTAN